MLTKLSKTKAQFGGSSEVIDRWLDNRHELLVSYCDIAALQPSNNKSNLIGLPSPSELQNFCQLLVDYLSEGHFKLYESVFETWKKIGFSPTEEMRQIYEKIIATTEPLLQYADRYATVSDDDELLQFEYDLSNLGELMETRFEWEDKLIDLIAGSLAD